MLSSKSTKRLRVFAGPNGSGKSTIVDAIQKYKVNGAAIDFGVYVNADDIANLAFIGGKTNRQISDKAPAKYFPALIDKCGTAVIQAQCIPVEVSLLDVAAYKEFLAARRRLISSRLNEFLGTVAG